jgi:hypothetical protein
MKLPIENTLAGHFKKGDTITFITPRNGKLKGEILSIIHNRINSLTYVQVDLTPPISLLNESELSRNINELNKKEESGSVVVPELPPLLTRILLIYDYSSAKDYEYGVYKEKVDNGLNITHIVFPTIPFRKIESQKRGGKKYTKKSNKKNRKTNKRNTKYSK